MTNTILPVLRRISILPDALQSKLDRLFEDRDIHGVLVPLWVDDEQCLPCLAPRFLLADGGQSRLFSWNELEGRGSAAAAMADIGMSLMGHSVLHAELEEVVNSLPVCIGAHHVNALIMRDAVILSHDDIAGYVEDNLAYFDEEPQAETTRAPFCTMLVPTQMSAHAAVEECQRVARDLGYFRSLARRALEELAEGADLTLSTAVATALHDAEPLT